MKIRVGDTVEVIAGKDKGKTGEVLQVLAKEDKVIVEGVNMITKHVKPNVANPNGGIVNQESPIDISNVMYLYKGQPVRVGFSGEKKDKVRVARVNGKLEAID